MKESFDIPIFYYICDKNIRRCVMINEDTPIYLEHIRLKNFRCFKNNHVFHFTKMKNGEKQKRQCQWTVFLGNNGSGKTNLLQLISNFQPFRIGLAYERETKNSYAPYIYPYSKFARDNDFEVFAEFCYPIESNESLDNRRVNTLFEDNAIIPEGYCRIQKATVLSYLKSDRRSCDNEHLRKLHIYAYGVNRCNSGKNAEFRDPESNSDSLYGDSSSLVNLEDWLLQLELASRNGSEKAFDRIVLLKSLLCGTLLANVNDFKCVTDKSFNNHIEFTTPSGLLRYNELGYGYQSSLSWIFDFCKKMFERYPDSPNPLHEPAIVLVDELELHLHPEWQRTIIQDLSEMFPNTQFIVSTHSPLIIQSIKSINLYVLKNTSNGTAVERYPEITFQGWSVEEILRELMDLGDNVRSKQYRELKKEFESAMNKLDLNKGEQVYKALKEIIHPQNVENKLLEMDLGQLKAMQDD